jgi:ribosomal protein S12 methylthiotransferase
VKSDSKTTRIGVISLGCAKNLVDTEVMLGHLERAGCAFVDDAAEAEVIIVNTCSFIGPAREESIQTILEAAELKKSGRAKRLVVAGCMVQRYARELSESLPEVDAFIGLDELHRVVEAVSHSSSVAEPPPSPLLGKEGGPGSRPLASMYLYDHTAPRRRATPPWTAYVKIAEGCDHTCSFCPIPLFRGGFRSRDPQSVVAEARALAEAGVVEINLIAQDSSHYGRDRGDFDGLANLLADLNGVDGLRWIRLHYLYPNTVTDRLIAAMAELPKVVPYVDMPLQHAHPDLLQRMRRGGSGERHLQLLDRFRRAMPGAALRSTFIVGFPGETDAELESLKQFLAAAQFDHLGVFTYSHEESTAAGDLEDDVPEALKESRRDDIMELQQRIVARRLQEKVGCIEEVLVEGVHPETDLLLVGRMATQALDVDGQVLINDGVADAGAFVRVEITDVAGYDLVGAVYT